MNPKHIVITTVIMLLMCGTASAWWDASWNEREQITITGTRDGTNCIVELIINMGDYTDKIRADGYDVRFVNETTNTTIPAHDFSFTQTGNSTYYIKTNIATAGTEIYMYYNNSAASSYFDASSIYTTMDRFNRGDSGSVGNAEIGGTWTEVETCTITSNELYVDGVGSGNAAYAYIVNTSVSAYSGGIIQVRVPSSANNEEARFYVNGPNNNQQACVGIRNGAFFYGSSGNFYTAFSPVLSANNNQDYTVAIQHNNAASYSVWVDGVKKVTDSSYYADVSLQGYFMPCAIEGTGGAGTSYFDDAAKFSKSDLGATFVIGAAAPIISNEQPTSPISKYLNSSDFVINATTNEITNNKWEIDNGTGYTLEEWDNSTISPAYMFSPVAEGIGDYDVRLTAYNTSTGKDANTIWDVKVSYAWDRTLISQFDMCLCYYAGNLLCGDIDNDGSEECLAVGRGANQLVILETDGTDRTYNVADPYLAFWTSLKDVDENGLNDVLYTFNGNPGQSDALVNLYQFNATHINQSSVNNVVGVSSDNPHGIGWMEIDGDWRFYTAYCGGGEVTHAELNFSGFDYWQIDTIADSGEDSKVFDIDQDGVDELIIAGGFAGNSAVVYVYEINNATGGYTSKTTILSNSLDSATHYSCYLTHGDVDNDGIENLIVLWSPYAYTSPVDGIIEAYEFNTSYASGYEEGFEIADTGTGFLENSDTRTYVVDVDGDGDNELLAGMWGYPPSNRESLLEYYDVSTNGSSITKHVLYNFTDYYGSACSNIVTPSIINDAGTTKIACMVNNGTHSDFFLFERVPGTNDITITANKYGMLRKDVTVAQTFSTIASGFTHDVCFTWWDDVTNAWLSYWVGDSYNSAQSIPEHESYFVLMDGTGETVSCGVAPAETVVVPIGWSVTYLRESSSKTLTAIKADMGGNCADLYAWDHTVAGTGAWTNTGAYSVLPNQGLLVDASAGFSWDGSVP